MPFGQRFYIFTVTFCVLALAQVAARAVSITNLDNVPHRFEVYFIPGQEDIITIPPGATWRDYRPRLTIRRLAETPTPKLHARDYNEYVVWPGGDFGIQKARRSKGPNR